VVNNSSELWKSEQEGSISDCLGQSLSFSSWEAADISHCRLQAGDTPWANLGAVNSSAEQMLREPLLVCDTSE